MGKIPLGLTRETQLALIDLAHELRVSELYAAEYALNLGLYQLKKLDQDSYERHKRKWSQTLVESTPQKPLSPEEREANQKREELVRHFAQVKTVWETHKDNLQWVERTVNYAKSHLDIPGAAAVVALGEVSLQNRVLLQSQSDVVASKGGVSN